MARLVLLNVSMLLLLVATGIQSSNAWPYPEGESDLTDSEVMEKNKATVEDELAQEQTDDINAQEQLSAKDANAEADYAGLTDLENTDTELSQEG